MRKRGQIQQIYVHTDATKNVCDKQNCSWVYRWTIVYICIWRWHANTQMQANHLPRKYRDDTFDFKSKLIPLYKMISFFLYILTTNASFIQSAQHIFLHHFKCRQKSSYLQFMADIFNLFTNNWIIKYSHNTIIVLENLFHLMLYDSSEYNIFRIKFTHWK